MRTTISSPWLDRSVPRPGETIDGKYLVDRRCESTGSIIVLNAMHLPHGEPATVEMLRPASAAQDIVVEWFLREGEAAMRVRSDHAVRVLDRGQLRDGAPYLVLERVQGRSLEEVVSTWGRLPVPMAVDWVLQATEAIAQAHSYEVVHGRLTPATIFLTRRPAGTPWIKVSFGPAGLAEPPVSPTSSVDVDIRALGAVLAFLLTGGPPSGGLAAALASGGVPGPLALDVRRCLRDCSPPPFASVAELARALAPFGTTAARVSCERIECLLDGRVSELTRPKARPDLQKRARPSDPGRGRPLAHPASGRVVVIALAMLAALGTVAFWSMYMSVPRGAPPSLGVAAMQPAAGSVQPASRTTPAPSE